MTACILAHFVILSLISLPLHSSGPPALGMVLATFRLALPISTKLRQPSSTDMLTGQEHQVDKPS